MPTYSYSASNTNTPKQAILDNSSKKNRIYQVFKPTIVLDELSMPAEQKKTDSFNEDNTLALEYPLVKINGYVFSKDEVESLKIDCTNFIPSIQLSVFLTNDKFLSKEWPKDGDIISIAIRQKNDLINIIRNDYVITSAPTLSKTTLNKVPTIITFFGKLFVPGLESSAKQFGINGTSMEFFKYVAKYLQLGFCTNEDVTDDKQCWLVYQQPMETMKEIINKVWKDKNSFFDIWIDPYYNLNFVNINKQLLSPEDDVDLSASLTNINSQWIWGAKTDQKDVVAVPKVFSNYKTYRNTSFYIMTWRPINRSSSITFENGTSMITCLVEHNQTLWDDTNSQKSWTLDISPTYDPNKTDKFILLRGRSKWDASVNEGGSAQSNYSYVDLYKKNVWMGIQYTSTNTSESHDKWNGNHHKNYLRAHTHNVINLKELEKLNVEIVVQGTNLNVLKGEKIPVALIKTDIVENRMVHKESYDEALDFFYSGYYMVKGFTLSYVAGENDENGTSNFSQTFILTRREWPTPVPIKVNK